MQFKFSLFVLSRFEKTDNSGLFKAFFKEEKGQKNKFKRIGYFVTIPKTAHLI